MPRISDTLRTRIAGLINDLGRRALAAAAKLLTQFANHPELATVRVNVNISPIHVAAGLERDVLATVRRIPDPTMLGLEFVETGLIGQAEADAAANASGAAATS